jgi:hypothetical protein
MMYECYSLMLCKSLLNIYKICVLRVKSSIIKIWEPYIGKEEIILFWFENPSKSKIKEFPN